VRSVGWASRALRTLKSGIRCSATRRRARSGSCELSLGRRCSDIVGLDGGRGSGKDVYR